MAGKITESRNSDGDLSIEIGEVLKLYKKMNSTWKLKKKSKVKHLTHLKSSQEPDMIVWNDFVERWEVGWF